MSTVETLLKSYRFNRERTLGLLATIEKEPQPQQVLAWRPGPGRAPLGWQLMHIGITEEIFATERLNPAKTAQWTELWPRFRGGSTPDENLPTAVEIRAILTESRERLLATLASYGDDRLDEIPETLKERGFRVIDVLHIIGWHEAHHQGQAHLTLNLHKAAHSA